MTDQTVPQPIQPVSPTPVTDKHQSPLLIIILVILVLFSLGTAGFMYWQNQQLAAQVASLTTIQTTKLSPVPTVATDPTSGWKTYSITPDVSFKMSSYQIKLPTNWLQIEHSSNFQNTETFQDSSTDFTFQLIINQEKNLNPETNKPYTTLKELTGLPYDVPMAIVDGQQAGRVLPRAGSESDYKYLFFSKDNKYIISIELDTPRDGSKIQDGETLVSQIISTFKFTDTTNIKSYTLSEAKAACIKLQGSIKVWDDQYQECNEGALKSSGLESFCNQYGGTFVPNASSCRHALANEPCGPTVTFYCSFANLH